MKKSGREKGRKRGVVNIHVYVQLSRGCRGVWG
jgi:hypothetical protein